MDTENIQVKDLDLPENIKHDYIDSGITELNPPQELAVEAGLMKGEDLIVASPTASGKTFIAELAIVNQVVENGGKAVYIVPLKALASEKYEDFSERYENLNVSISVGDLDDEGDYLENSDIVVTTSEKLDSMLRHNPSWIHEIELVVTDEIHLLTSENRGPTLEVTLTRLRDLLDFQMLGLSATISNSDELADWLDAELVESNYRPVELKEGIMEGNTVEFYPDDYERQDSDEKADEDKESGASAFKTGTEIQEEKEKEVESETFFVDDHHGRKTLNLVENTLEKDKQTIIFCSSRKGAEKSSDRCGKIVKEDLSRGERKELKRYADDILNVLGSPTSQCERLAENVEKGAAFHHAGLCVSGDSLILHPDGSFSKMDDLIENDRWRAIGLQDYDLRENKIRNKYEMKEKPVLEIKTNKGRKIRVSKNHQLPVLGEEGLKWRKARNLLEDERIATPRQLNIETDTPQLRKLLRDEVRTYRKYDEVKQITENTDTEKLELFENRHSRDRNISVGGLREICQEAGEDPSQYLDTVMPKGGRMPLKIPKELDKDVAWMIGAVAGDGHITSSEVNLSGSEDRILDRFEEIVNSKFDREVSVTERDQDSVKTFCLSSKAVSDILNDYFGIPRQKKAHNLRMPDVGLPDDLLASYIRGLYDTDGSVNRRENSDGASCIEFYTASEELATELHTSLLRFGINAHRDLRETEGRKTTIEERDQEISTNGDIHRILIYGSDQLKTFRDKIGFTHPRKKSKLEKSIETNPEGGRNQNDVIPKLLGTKVRKTRNSKDLSLSNLEPEVPKSTVSRFENHKNPIKRKTFQKIAKKLDNEELQQIANSDIYWDKIESIEEKEPEKLYDISTSTENFIANGIIAHNTTEQRQLVEQAFKEGLIRTVSATPTLAAGVNLPAFRVIMRDLKRYTGRGMEFIPVLEYEQMTGRAGRPKYDDYGEAISIAKNPGTKDKILERFVLGEPERIQSKLAAEPILRMHTLSLIASNYCNSMEDVYEFYSKTFYAYQFGDFSEVKSKVKSVVEDLIEYEFLDEDIDATPIGKRVSELYIDPDSANLMLESLKRTEEKETKPVSYLFMLSRTTEMQPRPRVKDDERSDIQQAFNDAEKYILEDTPREWDPEYDHFLECMKNSMVMQGWISEVDEEELMDKYGVAPGGIRAKMKDADWLLYAAKEMARMEDLGNEKELEKLRIRLQHGIEKELLNLVEYDQIGRVRARKLHDHGIRDQESIREVSFEKLKRLIGDKTAKKLKKQVGEENIFDRENIMDYF